MDAQLLQVLQVQAYYKGRANYDHWHKKHYHKVKQQAGLNIAV